MATPAATLDALPLPRRVGIAQVLRELLRGERALADHYAALAAQPQPAPLRAGLAELARAKAAQVAAVESLVRRLGDSVSGALSGEPPEPGPRVGSRAQAFATAFQAERLLAAAYREVGALLGDPALCPDLPALAAEAARHRAILRDLYLRYS